MKYRAFIVFILCFFAYLVNLSPTITSDDSGELAGVAATLGTAHSPGYPLYSLAGKIVNTLIPYSNHAYRANLLSAITTAAGIAVLYLVLLKLPGSAAVSFFAAMGCGASFFVYSMATVTEVYGITILISALILYAAYSDMDTPKKFYLISYLLGLGFASHYIFGMWLPAIIYLYLKEQKFSFKNIMLCLLFFVIGLSVFLYLPVRSLAQPLYDWEDPQTLKKFLQVVLRTRYGALNLAQGKMNFFDFSLWSEKAKFLVKSLMDGFSVFGFAAGATGIFLSFRKGKFSAGVKSVFLFILLAGSGPLFIFLANVRIDATSAELLSRFLFLTAVVWTVYIVLALRALGRFSTIAALVLFAAISAGSLNLSNRNHFTFYDYAKNLLRNAPRNSLLLFDRADEMEFCVSYLLRVEKRRPDAEFIDCNAGVSRSIYGDGYYKIWGPPRLAARNKVEERIISDSKRPVLYATFLPNQTTTAKKPYGLLYAAKFEPRFSFPTEVFILRPPQDEIRSKSLFSSHFQLLGDYCLMAGEEKKAAEYFDYSFYTTGPHPYLKLGHYFFSKGLFDEARKYYEKITIFYPRTADAYVNLGVIADQKGNLDAAENYYRKAIEIDEKNPQAYYNLGVVCWKRADWKNAVRCFEAALDYDQGNTRIKQFIEAARRRI